MSGVPFWAYMKLFKYLPFIKVTAGKSKRELAGLTYKSALF